MILAHNAERKTRHKGNRRHWWLGSLKASMTDEDWRMQQHFPISGFHVIASRSLNALMQRCTFFGYSKHERMGTQFPRLEDARGVWPVWLAAQ